MGQTPLPSTVKDFICMIYQEKCICIVTMDDLNESEKVQLVYFISAS
jgi:protein tyrosine phosphatase